MNFQLSALVRCSSFSNLSHLSVPFIFRLSLLPLLRPPLRIRQVASRHLASSARAPPRTLDTSEICLIYRQLFHLRGIEQTEPRTTSSNASQS